MTRPLATRAEETLVTLPGVQWALRSERLAARSVLPLSLGTMQRALKVALTERAWLMVTVQLRAPVQAPLQPVNFERLEAAARSVTALPWVKAWTQAEPQRRPAGVELTVPVPLPARFSVSALSLSKVAVTARSALGVTVQAAAPEQAPDQPVNDEPGAAVAVSVTGTAANGAEQVGPQSIPPVPDFTVPAPLPFLATVNVLPRKRTSANRSVEPSQVEPAATTLPSG